MHYQIESIAPIWAIFFDTNMKSFLVGAKGIQSQQYTQKGVRIPTTFIQTTPCYLVSFMQKDKQGYESALLAFKKTAKVAKPQKGLLDKAGIKTPLRFFKEFRLEGSGLVVKDDNGKKSLQVGETAIPVGSEIKPEVMFKVGQTVKVSAISKGKGFQGVVKRHGFKGGSRTHGQSDRERAPGAIGMTTTPGRVFKGKRMAGRMGNERTTIKGLEVVSINDQGITIKGLIPGGKGALVELTG